MKKIIKTRNVVGGNVSTKWNWLKHCLQWHSLSYDFFTNETTRAGLISVLTFCGQRGQTHLPMCLCVGGRMLLLAVTSGTIFLNSLTKVHCEGQQWSNAFTLSFSKFLCWQSITVQMSRSSGTTTARLQVRIRGLQVVGGMAVNKKIFFPSSWSTRLQQVHFPSASKHSAFSRKEYNAVMACYLVSMQPLPSTLVHSCITINTTPNRGILGFANVNPSHAKHLQACKQCKNIIDMLHHDSILFW